MNDNSDWEEIDPNDPHAVNDVMAFTADTLDDDMMEMRVTVGRELRAEWPELTHSQIEHALDHCEQMLRRLARSQAERAVRLARYDHFVH